MSEVARMRGDAVTIPEHSEVEDSQGNGIIERVLRAAEEMARTLKLDFGGRTSQKLNVTRQVIPGLVEHTVVDLPSRNLFQKWQYRDTAVVSPIHKPKVPRMRVSTDARR